MTRENDTESGGDADTPLADFGAGDRTELILRTHYRLVESGVVAPPGSPAQFEAIADAFRIAFLEEAGRPRLPARVDAAIEDAAYVTREEFGDRDADLRTEVLPAFHRAVAGYYEAFRDNDAPAPDADVDPGTGFDADGFGTA